MTEDNLEKSIEILIIEDNPGDVILIMDAFEEVGAAANFNETNSASEALDFLFHRGEYESAPTPDLIIMNIKLPRMSCPEFLETIKEKDFEHIPVIVLSPAQSEKESLEIYTIRPNSYLVKPTELENFLNHIKSLDE